MDRDELAKAIFDWLNRSQDEDGRGSPPYTFNADAEDLTVGVDGYLDCKKMADGVLDRLGLDRVGTGPAIRGTRSDPPRQGTGSPSMDTET